MLRFLYGDSNPSQPKFGNDTIHYTLYTINFQLN